MNRRLLVLALLFASPLAWAETPPLLQAAIGNWSTGKEEWSFLRRTKTLDEDGAVKEERLEFYDPSQPDSRRWKLLEVDGKAPTPEELEREARKNHKPRKYGAESPGQLLDLPHAVVKSETRASVTYEVPVHSLAAGLVQTNKLIFLVTVDRKSRTVERLTAQLRGPMRIALGLARITDVDLDLSFNPAQEKATAENTPSGGTARATLSAFGERMIYEWMDFKPVRPYAAAH